MVFGTRKCPDVRVTTGANAEVHSVQGKQPVARRRKRQGGRGELSDSSSDADGDGEQGDVLHDDLWIA